MSAPAALARRLVVVNLDGAEAIVVAPYRARTIIKALYWPLRRWDPDRGCWVVGSGGIHSLIRELRQAGYEIDLWQAGQLRTLKPTGAGTAVDQ